MTNTNRRRIRNLFALRDEAGLDDIIHIKFVTYWESLREELGLAMLLLLVEEYIDYTWNPKGQALKPNDYNE